MVLGRLSRTPGRFGRYARSLAAGAQLAVWRFPVAAMSLVAITILSNFAVAGRFWPSEPAFPWLVAALYAAAASSVVVGVAAESHGLARGFRLGGSILVAALIGGAVWTGFSVGIYPPALIAAATLAIPLAPYVGRSSRAGFWTFTFWTSVGTILAFLSVVLFVAGLSAILEMVRFLFNIGLSGEAYGHIYTTALTLIGPLFALGRIPGDFDETVSTTVDDRLIAGVRMLFEWVAIPLALVTAVILHLYAVKIVAAGAIPSGEIGWIVLFFALLVLSLRIAADPFLDGTSLSGRWFAKSFAAMLIVPLALLSAALWLRVASEGLTLQRYYLGLGAIAAMLVVAMQGARKTRGDPRWMAAVPVVLLAVSSFGPWGAAGSVGRSQASLIAAELPQTPNPDAVRRLDDASRAELRSRIDALDQSGQIDRLGPLMSPDDRRLLASALDTRPSDAVDVAFAAFGLSRPAPIVAATRSFTADGHGVIDIAGFDRTAGERQVVAGAALSPRRGPGGAAMPPQGVEMALDGNDLIVRIDDQSDRFDLASAIAQLPETVYSIGASDLSAPVVTLDSASGRKIKLALNQLVAKVDAAEKAKSADPGGAPAASRIASGVPVRLDLVSARLMLFYRASDWATAPSSRP